MKTFRDERMVHDKVAFAAGNEKIVLRVDKPGRQIIAELNKAKDIMSQVTNENMEETMDEAARAFAGALFGAEQADKLMKLYNNPASVVNVCGQYFAKSLKKKITKAQIA